MTTAHHKHRAIIFVHGILGFSSQRFLGKELYYFRALPPLLCNHLPSIHFPALPSVAAVEERARSLASYLGKISADRIDLIAHSMGGLDSRYLIQHFDPQRRIRSLTSIATPHRGSPLAQWVLDANGPLNGLLRRISSPGLHDLTPAACARFNAEIIDRSDVHYRSYAGVRPADEMPLAFRPWTRKLQDSHGDNDSQVPLSSAIWGDFQGQLRADHLELAGWSFGLPSRGKRRPFDHLGFYQQLIGELSWD